MLSAIAFAVLLAPMWLVARLRSSGNSRLSRVLDQHIPRRTSSKFDWTGSAVQLIAQIAQLLAVLPMFSLAYLRLIFVLDEFPPTAPLGRRMSDFLLRLLLKIGLGALSAVPGLVTIRRQLPAHPRRAERAAQCLRLDPAPAEVVPRPASGDGGRDAATARRGRLGDRDHVRCPYMPGSQSDVFKCLSMLFDFMLTLGSTSAVNQMMSGMVLVY